MKFLLPFIALVLMHTAWSQGWRDTLNLARNAYKSQDYDRALSYYEKAQKGAPDGVDLSSEMGQTAYKARKYDRAEELYKQSPDKKKSDAYHNLGNSKMKQKDYAGAIEAYKDALRMNPADDETRYNLSEAIRQQKQEQKQQQQQQDNKQNQSQKNQQQQQAQNQNNAQNQSQKQSSNKNQSQQGQGDGEKQQGQLSNKAVDRMLDDLMKKEAETKQRMGGGTRTKNQSKSGKDW